MKVFSLHTLLFIVVLFCSVGLTLAQDAPEVDPPTTVVYSEVEGQELVLDVYQPAPSTGDAPYPAVILIHGGGGSFGDRSDLADQAQGLADAGYVAFNIEYRLVSSNASNTWPAQLEDSQLAVRWVRANAAQYGVDPDRICSLGHSSGGQLASLLGMRDTPTDSELTLGEYSSRVACVVNIAGTADAAIPDLDPSFQPFVTDLMGGTASEVPELYRDASPLAQVDGDTVPFLVFHGTDDQSTSVEQSRSLVDALHAAGVEVVYVEYPHADHFSWLEWDVVAPETLAFLGRHLAAPPAK